MHSEKTYLPSVDGLRAISILLVIVSHIGLGKVIPGGLGVTIFFFISGFLITGLAIREVGLTGNFKIQKFYLRRFFRLFPAFALFMIVSVSFYIMIGHALPGEDIFSALFYLSNYYELYFKFTRFTLHLASGDYRLESPFPVLWSLAIEEHFYIVFPFFFAALCRSKQKMLVIMCSLCVIMLGWRLYLLTHGASAARTYFATDTRIDSILFGCIFAMILPHLTTLRLANNKVMMCGIAGISGFIIILSHFSGSFIFDEGVRYTVIGLCLMPIFCYILIDNTLASRFLGSSPMLLIGKCSYSLYLFHYISLRIADYSSAMSSMQRYGPGWLCIFAVSTVALTAISYLFVEHSLTGRRRESLRARPAKA